MFLLPRISELGFVHFKVGNDVAKFVQQLVSFFSRLQDSSVTSTSFLNLMRARLDLKNLDYNLISKIEDDSALEDIYLFELARAYEVYQNMKHRENVMNFEDQIFYCTKLLKQFPETVSNSVLIKYIIVDEFQVCFI